MSSVWHLALFHQHNKYYRSISLSIFQACSSPFRAKGLLEPIPTLLGTGGTHRWLDQLIATNWRPLWYLTFLKWKMTSWRSNHDNLFCINHNNEYYFDLWCHIGYPVNPNCCYAYMQSFTYRDLAELCFNQKPPDTFSQAKKKLFILTHYFNEHICCEAVVKLPF